jgi:hypothetical protein
MDSRNVDMFLMTNSKYYAPETIPSIKTKLESIPDDKAIYLHSLNPKDPTMMLIISILIGQFGIDRFMLGDTGLGVAKLLTCGGLGIWAIVDWFLIMDRTREVNFQRFMTVF